MSHNPYLQLLSELGIEIAEEEWNRVHEIVPEPEPTLYPSEPFSYNDVDGMPQFTASQLEWDLPERHGFLEYDVIDDEAHAHPFALNYHDEIYYRANYRAKHRYSRPYRIRWTLSHLIGIAGKLPHDVALRLQTELPAPYDVLHTRAAHEWVRARLKAWGRKELYLSVPYIVAQLGGPRWRVSTGQTVAVYEDAIKLHTVFDALRKQGRMGRQRFPKMQYVLLKLLDRHGVVAPYRVPWARTSIKRRQLRDFLTSLDDHKTPWILPTKENEPADGTTTEAGPSAASWPGRNSPCFCNATPTSSEVPDKSCPPRSTTPPAGCTTTTTENGACLSATIPCWEKTSEPGSDVSTR